jgi:hypothetical protein
LFPSTYDIPVTKNIKSPQSTWKFIFNKIQVFSESKRNINRKVFFHTAQRNEPHLMQSLTKVPTICTITRECGKQTHQSCCLISTGQNQSHKGWNNGIEMGDHMSKSLMMRFTTSTLCCMWKNYFNHLLHKCAWS